MNVSDVAMAIVKDCMNVSDVVMAIVSSEIEQFIIEKYFVAHMCYILVLSNHPGNIIPFLPTFLRLLSLLLCFI